jgi:UDP-2,3-diacylglucosamine pyrophosphatase LpxH
VDDLRESLLVFSDVHLGSDLNDRPVTHIRRSACIDRDLVRFLDHYREAPEGADRWRVVIAGDFIDFIGMSVDAEPSDSLATTLDEEEREHGLGNSSDHARAKLRRVAKRHPDVFEALGSMVARGHALTVVHGNHDVEFHWEDVQTDFRALLLAAAERTDEHAELDAQAFCERIEFNPWFFYWNGVAYIEHGHQYDPFCATDFIMAPLSPLDPRRVARGFCDVLLRYVVRPTAGLREAGHETKGAIDYFLFGARLGLRGMARLAMRFAEAVIVLFRLRRAHWNEAARALRAEHERRMALLAEATRIGKERIRALAALQSPPITRSIRGILASVLLDRLALALLCAMALVVTGVLGFRSGHFFFASASIALGWILGHRYLAKQRQLDPAEQMADRASQLARLLPAAFVVMGHTHAPLEKTLSDGAARYINVGAWAEEEPEEGSAPRTHLVIKVQDGKAVAELRTWSAEGPKRYGGPPPSAIISLQKQGENAAS